MQTLAIIPARGGSKRIPTKNIKSFAGKPIIARSIEAAHDSCLFDKVVVSTDSDKIAAVAEACGAEVPFRRPAELSDDHAPTLPVVAHAINWWEKHRSKVGIVCCIHATAPFLQAQFLRAGLKKLQENKDAEFAFGVTSYAFPIFRALKLSDTGCVEMFWPENEAKRSQDVPEAWHDAGQFYWGYKKAFLSCHGVFNAKSYAVALPRHFVQDIDTMEDWERAERMFAAWSSDGKSKRGEK